jgi:Predicted pPIWI-associating nuclease
MARSALRKLEPAERARRIADEVKNLELTATGAWSDLDILSSNTQVEAIEVFEDEIRQFPDRFEGPINVHVTLNYPEDVMLSETFPGRFEGRWDGDTPSIANVSVDTSSFYA